MRKSEKLKKIQLLLNQKNLYEDQFEEIIGCNRRLEKQLYGLSDHRTD